MKGKVLVAVVIICLVAGALAASSERNRQHNRPRQRTTRHLPAYLQPPPHFGGPSPSPGKTRLPTPKPRGHHHQPTFQNHQQNPELSKSLAQRVARWFFEGGNDDGPHPQSTHAIKQQSPPWAKPSYGSPKPPPRNFHGPPNPHSVYGPSRPPSFRGPIRQHHYAGPQRPSYGPPPPHTLNLPPNPNHLHRAQPQYLPLTHQSSDSQGRCNPCNKVPWVPLPQSSVGGSSPGFAQGFRNIEQLPLEGFGNAHGVPDFPPFSGPSGNDRPVEGPPDSSYGPPLLPHSAPGPPFNSGHPVSGPSDSYGQPLQGPSNQYGPPYPASDQHDTHQGHSNGYGGQSFSKQHSNELAVNINEQFGYASGHDPQSAASHHSSQDGSVHLVPDSSNTDKFHTSHEPNSVKQLDTAGASHLNSADNERIEVVKSVRVADFLASVEYPLEVIQSPVIDIDQSSSNSQNGEHTSPAVHQDSGRQQGSDYGNNNGNTNNNGEQNFAQNIDQKEQQATVHQVVSTANGKIIKGRPIVVDGSLAEDVEYSEANKVKAARPVDDKGDTNLNHSLEYNNQVRGVNKYQESGESGEFQTGTTTFDFTPSLQTQAQGTSLIHNINNLNIFTQQLPPSAPFSNTFQQIPGHVNFPHGVNSNLPSNKPLPSPTPFQNNFQHPPPPPPVDLLKGSNSNSNQQTFNLVQTDTPVPYLNPPREDVKANFVTNPPVDTSSWVPIGSTTNSQTTWNSKPIVSQSFNHHDSQAVASFNSAGMLPPPPPRPYQPSKKPKQIQVIVPYTSSKQLLQYQFDGHHRPALDHTGWLPLKTDDERLSANQARKVPETNCSVILQDTSSEGRARWQKCREFSFGTNHQSNNALSQGSEEDYHQYEESRTVTATIAQTPRTLTSSTAGGIHHIFAPNIRALLKGEEDRVSPESLMFRLQKNIDEWTALEYSSGKGSELIRDEERKGTTSLLHLLVPSKKIPDAYLTTTPSTFDDETIENMVATSVPSRKKNVQVNKNHDKSYRDHEVSSSNTNSRKILPEKNSTDKLKINNDPQNILRKYEDHEVEKGVQRGNWGTLEANLIVPEASTATSTTTESTAKIVQRTWERLQMSISPITKEKVYVVTPMSIWNPDSTPTPYQTYNRFLPQSHTKASRAFNSSFYNLQTTPYPTTGVNDQFPFRNDAPPQNTSNPYSFHSPRFLIRPTPGVNHQRTSVAPEQRARSSSVEDNSVIDTYESNFDNRKTTASIRSTPENTTPKSILPALTDIPVYTPPNGAKVHTISGHSKVVTMPTTPTTSRRKWTGYDVIRPTTSTPDDPESFLRSLAKLLTAGNGPTLAPGETVGGSISAAVREAKKKQEAT